MAARNTNIACVTSAPTALTDGAVTAVRVSNLGDTEVWLQATATNVAPGSAAGAVPLTKRSTLAADLTLANLFPGVGSGALYLWAFADKPVALSVSHA